MSEKTTTWAYYSTSPSQAEMIQRIAFTFGYKWRMDTEEESKTPQFLRASYYYFYPEAKTIKYSYSPNSDTTCKTVTFMSEVLDLLKNTPEVEKERNTLILWVYENKSLLETESLQRLAFSFGWKWYTLDPKQEQEVQFGDWKYVLLYPREKKIAVSNVLPSKRETINGLNELMEHFKKTI